MKSSRAVFEVLREISKADVPLGAAEIARLLSLPITTAARALNTLEAAGYVARYHSSAKFVLGKSGQRLAYAFMANFPIRDLALPYLQQLTLLSGNSSSLFTRLGWYSVRIALIAGTSSIINVGAVGEARPLTIGAPSLAMLAQLSEEDATRALQRNPVTAQQQLREVCARIRKRGYACEVSSMESGGYDLAFPLCDPTRSILGCIALEGLASGADKSQIEQARQVISPLQDILAHGASTLAPHYEHIDPDEIDLG
ncbi:helix-turn-helix domain-containing protein [Bradyrhizobium sp. LHD-71]|uniref:IclR family transcriptional regulator n=1 Tax=Bradyrhizobium sp. LHD-71 TaxID=3072141 RepID=UPI00280DD55D|nr:helix-turn-helix domain-containing protein [Bradyrhizobium sp. LHD-71]MDQ8727979.1 helix-turn-helix domain-containing protein [Bradyrhizobium sp. LHD-71]